MNVKLRVLTAGALFFTGQMVSAQEVKKDSLSEKEIETVELVSTGFGRKQKIKELTGAVGKIDKSIADMSSGSVDKALSGKVAGLQTGMATGQPGGAAEIRIRGFSSINGRNNPIIIVDGVRVAQGDLTQNSTTGNILANLNEADIESMTVLKDAVSTAVYGADAGAGVVIITTKSGKKGKAKFGLSSELGVSFRAIKGHEGLRADEWKSLLTQSLVNRYGVTEDIVRANIAAGVYGNDLRNVFASNADTDWRKETEKTGGAFSQRISASLSGGSDRLIYYTSLGYFNQEGVVKGSSFQRITGSSRVNYKATDRLSISTDLQMSYGTTKTLSDGGSYSNPVSAAYFIRPTDPVRNPDGSYYLGNRGRLSNTLFNVAALQEFNYRKAKTARVFANIQADYRIARGLNYKFVIAPEFINIEEDQYLSPLHGDGYNLGGGLYGFASRFFNFNVQNILSYDFKLGDKHNFSASVIQEAYKSDFRMLGGYSNVVGSTNLFTLDNFILPRTIRGKKTVNSRGGYAATFHYDYDKLFLLDLSGRQDRVSNFWPDKKTGYFWSAGIGVDLARLEAIKSIEAISLLKFTASYGLVGNMPNDSVSPYYNYVYTLNYADRAGARPEGIDNSQLEWEKIKPLNVGFDLGLFNDRITFGAAYYNKKSLDMIFDVPLSMVQAGYTPKGNNILPNKWVNVGSMRNSGLEFTFNAKIFDNENFKWSLGGNLSTLNNKILELKDGKDVPNGTIAIHREGEIANAFYLRKWAGVDPSNGKPLWYKNGKGGETTSNYAEAERAIQGGRFAKLFGGFDTQISFKNFAVEAQFSYGFGNKIYDSWAIYNFNDGQTLSTDPGYKDQLDYWTPQNPNAKNPAPIYGRGNNSANQASTRFLYKGDYMRLRTLKVSYTFNKEVLGNSGLNSAQIYLLGNNVWTHTFDKNLKYDPDLAVNGLANLTLPPIKTFILGVNLTF